MDAPDDKSPGDDRTVELVRKAGAGDQGALDALYRLYEDRLVGAVRKRLGTRLRSHMETGDLIQSVWGDVLGDIDRFRYRGQDSFFRWLFIRVIRKIQDKGRYFAAGKRDGGPVAQFVEESASPGRGGPGPAPDPTPSQAMHLEEKWLRIKTILAGLTEPQRQVVLMKIWDGRTFEEIGRALGKSSDAVRQSYYRALKLIHDRLPRSALD